MHLDWMELPSAAFAALDPQRTVALLPVAAVEQHGPHLPVGVDALIGRGIVERALPLLGPDTVAVLLPAQTVGYSGEHAAFAGTLTAGYGTLAELWTAVGDGVAAAGLRKLVIFNSHGGQPQIVDIAALELRRRHRMLVAGTTWFALAPPRAVLGDRLLPDDIHAGLAETAMMLALRPDLVDRGRIRNFRPDRTQALRSTGPAGFAWCSGDLHPSGAIGDPRAATAADGERLLDAAAAALARVLDDAAAFDLSQLAG